MPSQKQNFRNFQKTTICQANYMPGHDCRGVQTLLPPFSGTPKVSLKLVRATFSIIALVFPLYHLKYQLWTKIPLWSDQREEIWAKILDFQKNCYIRALGTLRTGGYRHCYPRFPAPLRYLRNLLEPLFWILVSSFHYDTRKSSIYDQNPDMRRQTVKIWTKWWKFRYFHIFELWELCAQRGTGIVTSVFRHSQGVLKTC